MSEEEFGLSRIDRYFLSNQLRIIEALYPDDANHTAITREAFERGYEILYRPSLEHIFGDSESMSVSESKEVWDTMDMFDAIDRAIREHGVEIAEGMPIVRFQGYDGNNEGKFMSFSAFTVERLERFTYLKTEKKGYWNSHHPIRSAYQRMLEEFKKVPIARRFNMNKEELRAVLQAAIHPEQRQSENK